MTDSSNILPSILRLAQLQNAPIDRLELQGAIESSLNTSDAKSLLKEITQQLHLKSAKWLSKPDPVLTPGLLYSNESGWGILQGVNAQGMWITHWWDDNSNQWNEIAFGSLEQYQIATVQLARPFRSADSAVYKLVLDEILSYRKLLFSAAVCGLIINTVALGTSFYTMQVYNRVVPTGAIQTLLVLTLGVFFMVLYELLTKNVRTRFSSKLIDLVDQRLARSIFTRFLQVRLDQLPQSIGSLAAQMKGYEAVRGFLASVISRLLIDGPFVFVFVYVIFLIAGPLAFIPFTFFVLSVLLGWYYHREVDLLAGGSMRANNFKTGLLVESVEGAETIKSGQSGWRMLSRWMNTTDEARDYETRTRNISEYAQHLTATFQQFSYVLLIASGALLVSQGELTIGGLIACSILSGRVLAPVATIPTQLVQWAHTKAALKALDALWALEDDHHLQEQPVVLEHIRGHYRFEQVEAKYGQNMALSIPNLTFNPGEKIGVLGPVGAGKTTLLRVLSGMYKPQAGRIFLDDVDLSQISKPILAESTGYLQQEGRLFAGSLRENLTLGLLDPGDEAIMEAARLTGLLASVITPHPEGLQQKINEGGTGLSGGQRQLANLTRIFLRKPRIWLLDEPSASMDRALETQILGALNNAIEADHMLVLITHKTEMLSLISRLIVIVNNKVVLDGPRDEVLQKLRNPQKTQEKIA